MASNTLTNNFISQSYTGLIHAQAEQLPSSGKVKVYDGAGNQSAILLGRKDSGCSIYSLSASSLTVAGVQYPAGDGAADQVPATDGAGQMTFRSVSTLLSGLTSTTSSFSNYKLTVVGGAVTSIEAQEAFPRHRCYVYRGNHDSGNSTYPSQSVLDSFLKTQWADARNGDLAQVTFFKTEWRQTNGDDDFRGRQFVFTMSLVGGNWIQAPNDPASSSARGALNSSTFTAFS
tara:strand:- start:7640 stop:8332 length:693 start_codon:yes stop_codon:yes gene_type:complete